MTQNMSRLVPENVSATWIVEGAECVLFTPSRNSGGGGTITARTIARLTPRNIVLDDGTRLRRARPWLERSSSWDPRTELLPPSDQRVMDARKANAANHIRAKVIAACDDLTATLRGANRGQVDTAPLRAALDRLDVLAAGVQAMTEQGA